MMNQGQTPRGGGRKEGQTDRTWNWNSAEVMARADARIITYRTSSSSLFKNSF